MTGEEWPLIRAMAWLGFKKSPHLQWLEKGIDHSDPHITDHCSEKGPEHHTTVFWSQVLFDSVFFRNNMRRRELCRQIHFSKTEITLGVERVISLFPGWETASVLLQPLSQQYCSWEKRWATGVSQKRQLQTVTEMVPCFSKIAFQPSRCKAAHRTSWERGEGTGMEPASLTGVRRQQVKVQILWQEVLFLRCQCQSFNKRLSCEGWKFFPLGFKRLRPINPIFWWQKFPLFYYIIWKNKIHPLTGTDQ